MVVDSLPREDYETVWNSARTSSGTEVTYSTDSSAHSASKLLLCTTVDPRGMEQEVRFEFDGEGVDLFFEQARLMKSA